MEEDCYDFHIKGYLAFMLIIGIGMILSGIINQFDIIQKLMYISFGIIIIIIGIFLIIKEEKTIVKKII